MLLRRYEPEESMATNQNSDPPEGPLQGEKIPLIVREAGFDRERHPDLDEVQAVTLKDGPLARKVATRLVILDRHTGEVHHDTLTIKTFRKKQDAWGEDLEHSIALSSEGEDEIQKLIDFLLVARGGAVPKKSAQYMVVPAPGAGSNLQALHKMLSEASAPGKVEVLAEVLKRAADDTDVFEALLDR